MSNEVLGWLMIAGAVVFFILMMVCVVMLFGGYADRERLWFAALLFCFIGVCTLLIAAPYIAGADDTQSECQPHSA